jgi:PAS domain S-box-containing protein
MSLSFLLILFITLANLTLGLWVWLHNPRHRINQCFAIFSITVACWSFSNGLVAAYASTTHGYLWGRLAFASASLMPLSFLLFVTFFPSPSSYVPPVVLRLFTFGGLGAFILSLSPLVVRETASLRGTLHVIYGPLYPLVGLYMVSCFVLSVAVLTMKLRSSRGLENLQIRYLLLGFFAAGLGATITNLLFPFVFKTSGYSQYGPFFSILMMAVTAHSIIRYRLLDIRLVIRRGIAYVLAAITTGTVFLTIVWLTSKSFVTGLHEVPLEVQFAFVLLIALAFQPIRQWFQTCLDRYFFRSPYNYQNVVREISRKMRTWLNLQSLLNYICDTLARTVQPEAVWIFIRNPQGSGFAQAAAQRWIPEHPSLTPPSVLDNPSALTALLTMTRTYFLRDDVHRWRTSGHARAALADLDRFPADLALPILHEEHLLGLLIVSPKLSGDPYFPEDIDLLTTLVNQAAIAIKNAQLYQELTRVNEYVANIVATMESAVISVDATGRITLFNPAAERMMGFGTDQLRDQAVTTLPVFLANALTTTLRTGRGTLHAEALISAASGRHTPISWSTHLLIDSTGHKLGAIAVLNDLTRLKQLEGERRRAERLASIGALASGIAHEIKNPLVAIKTFAELLPERFSDHDFRDDFSQVVIREIERIDHLVARLRGLATPSAQALTPIDVRQPLEETLALLRAQLEQQAIRVHRRYDTDIPPVLADPAQLKQLFLNVFMNSIEAMPREGELVITVMGRGVPHATSLVVEVTDSGSGIPDTILSRVFDPFVTTKPQGSGLGLAICRGIADAHKATIRAMNNRYGHGATVAIEFHAIQEGSVAARS